jgi:hypothetical protein
MTDEEEVKRPQLDSHNERLIDQSPFAKGTSREVFRVPTNDSIVIKRTLTAFPGANFVEWNIWNAIKQTDLIDVFGACTEISESGRYLVMEYLRDISTNEAADTPTLPDWVTDVKGTTIFGRGLDGKVKVRDYALVNLSEALAAADRWRRPWQK